MYSKGTNTIGIKTILACVNMLYVFGISSMLTLEEPHVLFAMNVPSKVGEKFSSTSTITWNNLYPQVDMVWS
jgi:hypothetical protein